MAKKRFPGHLMFLKRTLILEFSQILGVGKFLLICTFSYGASRQPTPKPITKPVGLSPDVNIAVFVIFSTACECNPSGSYHGGEICDPYSGQCPCKYGARGRQCNKCPAGYYNFPNCKCKCMKSRYFFLLNYVCLQNNQIIEHSV